MNTIPIYKAIIDDEAMMSCLSLVSMPAVEQDFLCFDKEEIIHFDADKQYITGVVMLADTPIYRCSKTLGEYYLVFDKDNIKKMVEKYLASGMFSNVSCQHDGNLIEGLSLVETYFVDDTKPSPFKVPEGSVVMTFRCSNKDVWDRIKAGELKGFSLEAMLSLEPTKFEEQKEQTNEVSHEVSYEEWVASLTEK